VVLTKDRETRLLILSVRSWRYPPAIWRLAEKFACRLRIIF
jgi:hypothetical protein